LETNILIDDLPTDYNGYLINYTFKSGILISECLNDNSFKDEREKVYTALRILFGRGIPPIKTALDGLKWFLSGGMTTKNKDDHKNSKNIFSFVKDRNMIFSAFMMKYNINLNKSNMHFFEFLSLFNDLDKTAFKRVVDLRTMTPKEIKSYSREQRQKIYKLKEEFALEDNNQQQEEKTKFDLLMEKLNDK
jgi:hypothetical protein